MRQIFGEYKPDQPAHLNDGVQMADGVYPIANGYAPLPQFAAAGNGTLAAKCLGAAAYRVGGTVYTFAATATNIYKYTSSGYSSLKGSLTTSGAVGVRFCDYNDWMVMTNGTDAVQKFDPGTSTTVTANLGGSPPTGRFIGKVKSYLVLGYASGDPLKMAWSDIGDPEIWSSGDAGTYFLSGGGDITGFVGGEDYGIILQENRVVRMVPTFDDERFVYQEISKDIGCIAPWSVAPYGKLVFFLSNQGWMATDGYTVDPIGWEKIDRTFLNLFNRTYISNMSAAVDPLKGLLFASVPSANPTSQVFIYSFGLKRWTTAPVTSERIFPALSQSINLDSLDALYPDGLDSIPVSLDSTLFRGGYPLLLLFDGSHQLGTLSGAPMGATLKGPEQEIFGEMKTRMTEVKPMSDAGTVEVTVFGRNDLSETQTAKVFTSRTGRGRYKGRFNYAYSQLQFAIPAGTSWSFCQGADTAEVPGGRA